MGRHEKKGETILISIFAKPSYLGNVYPGKIKDTNTHRLSSRIRGEEISRRGGFKLNPRSGHEDDVKIYVKPTGFGHIPDGAYIDILDGLRKERHWSLRDRPGVKLIAASQNSLEVLKSKLPNEVVLVPHHHVNMGRLLRSKKMVDTCGYIGSPSPYAVNHYKKVGKGIEGLGMGWKTCFNYKTIQDAIDLYMSIDVMVVAAWEFGDPNPFKIPTKIINAASFGIPTIAFPLEGYKEIEGYYVPARNLREVQTAVNKFKDKDYYNEWSSKVSKMAEQYHIDRVLGLYRNLK